MSGNGPKRPPPPPTGGRTSQAPSTKPIVKPMKPSEKRKKND